MEEIRAETWSQLHELLYEDSWHEKLRRFRSDRVFRGQQDAARDLRTSLARIGGDYADLERHLLRNFRKYAHRDTRNENFWDWLAVAKHHGLPTRVLDWTHSPFVALHFATATPELFGVDGVVWTLDYVRAAEHLPEQLRTLLADEGSNSFTTEMLAQFAASLEELDALARDEDFVLFLEPPSLDDRIVNQFALFSLMSSAAADLHAWLEGHSELVRRIVVPAELKWEVRDKLDQANVTERVLFPGLDGIALWLRRQYSQRAT
ncbi:MAG TPA: FRG domain-containing protein [Gaiellaceae bacterium]|nr:FRG domain-containing protein [Gaiellaceae bacterium]